jgi:hypothetical protein
MIWLSGQPQNHDTNKRRDVIFREMAAKRILVGFPSSDLFT